MVLLKLLVFTLTFHELIVHVDAKCSKGQRLTADRKSCRSCSPGTYNPVDWNSSQKCTACTKCDEDSGSIEIEACTKEKNARCQCRGEFVPSDDDSSTCKCDVGFGLKDRECSKCKDGYFSSSIDSPCQKWRECKSGVHTNGTTTSDVTCIAESKSNTTQHITTTPTAPTSNKAVSLIKLLTSQRPPEGAHTPTKHTTTATTTTGHTIAPKKDGQPLSPVSHFGAVLIFGVVGLLVLTAVICKLYIVPCMERQPLVQKNESLCRRPVEESGDDSQTPLKLNPGEP